MSLGIIRGEVSDVLERLKSGDIDSDEYTIRQYETADSQLEIAGKSLQLLQGINAYPRDEFVVDYEDRINETLQLDEEPPGILPYITGAYQVRKGNPDPFEVGIPLLSGDSTFGIRWLLETSGGKEHEGTEWQRLTEKEVQELPSDQRPDESVVTSTRRGRSIPSAAAYPESVEIIESRIEEYWWEAWTARNIKTMNSWRILIPSTSKYPMPTLLGPTNTIVSENFNVALIPDGITAVAVALVLARSTSQDFLKKITSWSRGSNGGTPRTRIKHIAPTILRNEKNIQKIIDKHYEKLEETANSIEQFHALELNILKNYITRNSTSDVKLRETYTKMEGNEFVTEPIKGITAGEDPEKVIIETDKGKVKLSFHEPESAACMAVGCWLATGFGHSTNQVLDLPSRNVNPELVKKCLLNPQFLEMRSKIEEEI